MTGSDVRILDSSGQTGYFTKISSHSSVLFLVVRLTVFVTFYSHKSFSSYLESSFKVQKAKILTYLNVKAQLLFQAYCFCFTFF